MGIYIPTDLDKLQEYNYVPMVQKIARTLQQYEKGMFSWIGRISIVKMDILPKILYVLQTIPIFPSTNTLDKLHRSIGKFVWGGKTPRIKRTVLNKTKEDGGLALPDIDIYLRAIMITRIVDWSHNRVNKQWVKLEEDITTLKLKSLPWIKKAQRPPEREMPSLVVATLKAWDNMIKRGSGSTYRGPMTPLFSNPEFPLTLEAKTFLKWKRSGDTRIIETMEENKLLPLEKLGVEHKNKWMQYGLFQRYIESLTKESIIDRPLTNLEKFFLQELRPTHALSKIYKYLISENNR